MAGTLKCIKRLRDGSFLVHPVECARKSQAMGLLKTTRFVDRPVRVSIHKALNSPRGVIRCRELSGMTETEIKTELLEQGVVEVHRVTVKRDTENVPTNTLFLTFNTPDLPIEITVGYLKVKLALFVPNPMRCFNCNKFGHTSQRCKVAAKCPGCGKTSLTLFFFCSFPERPLRTTESNVRSSGGPESVSTGTQASSEKSRTVLADARVPCESAKCSSETDRGSADPPKTASRGSANPHKMASKGSAAPSKSAPKVQQVR